VPAVIGFAGSPGSPTVVIVTVPLKAWFLETLMLPRLATLPVVGSEI
jgi:hypothetical protein